MLGPDQQKWLLSELAGSTAAFKVIASGTMWSDGADKGGKDSWAGSWARDERDEIFSLLAYSVVFKNWQTTTDHPRGHNIGAVLVSGDNEIVNWARNCNAITGNGTQHGEVRLMIGYLNQARSYSLRGHTVYTSLEPCAQCSGMMIQQSIERKPTISPPLLATHIGDWP